MLSVTGSSSPHSQLPQYCHGLLQRRAAYQLMHEQQFLVLLPFLLRLWIVIKNIFILSLINTGNPNQQPTNRNTRNDCFNQHHLLTDTTSSSSSAPPPVHHWWLASLQISSYWTLPGIQLTQELFSDPNFTKFLNRVNAYGTRLIFQKRWSDQTCKWTKFIFSNLRAPEMWQTRCPFISVWRTPIRAEDTDVRKVHILEDTRVHTCMQTHKHIPADTPTDMHTTAKEGGCIPLPSHRENVGSVDLCSYQDE